MLCTRCGRENNQDYNFCVYCGDVLKAGSRLGMEGMYNGPEYYRVNGDTYVNGGQGMTACKQCGIFISSTAQFCPYCGASTRVFIPEPDNKFRNIMIAIITAAILLVGVSAFFIIRAVNDPDNKSVDNNVVYDVSPTAASNLRSVKDDSGESFSFDMSKTTVSIPGYTTVSGSDYTCKMPSNFLESQESTEKSRIFYSPDDTALIYIHVTDSKGKSLRSLMNSYQTDIGGRVHDGFVHNQTTAPYFNTSIVKNDMVYYMLGIVDSGRFVNVEIVCPQKLIDVGYSDMTSKVALSLAVK